VGTLLLRIVLALVPVGSIGILSWVPLIRTAALRRRAADWVAVGVVAALSTTAFAMLGSSVSDTDWQALSGGVTLLVLGLVCPVYFLVSELRWDDASRSAAAFPPGYPLQPWLPSGSPAPLPRYPAVPMAAPVPGPGPAVHLGQVRAELDELSALLHAQQRQQPQPGPQP
jgi:hypothetical protein